MVAVMALMESPAIIVGLILLSLWGGESKSLSWKSIMQHSFANASVLLILGSLLIGYIANAKQAAGITPFTSDLFKGFLSIFLLDMGLICGKEIKRFFAFGTFPFAIAEWMHSGDIVNIHHAGYFQSIHLCDTRGKRIIYRCTCRNEYSSPRSQTIALCTHGACHYISD
jgi:hypothetical protein